MHIWTTEQWLQGLHVRKQTLVVLGEGYNPSVQMGELVLAL